MTPSIHVPERLSSILLTGMGSTGGGSVFSPSSVTITTQATDTPTDNGTNVYTVPSGANALVLWCGRLPNARFKFTVYYKIGVTTRSFDMLSYQRFIVPAAAGSTVYFGSHERTSSGYATSAVSADVEVSSINMPALLTAPSGATGTANCDKSGPPFWTPTAAHIVLPDYGLNFQIDSAATYRDFFMSEKMSDGSWSELRHIHCNASENRIIRCVGKEIALMEINGATAAITAPTGSTIGGTSAEYRPAYTVGLGGEVTVTHTGTDVNSGDLFAADLKAIPTTNRDLVLTPGTYEMSTVGNELKPSNYTNAMSRNVRIRSSTGDPDDVVIKGAVWIFQQNSTTKWILEGLTFDVSGTTPPAGATSVFDTNMNTTLHNCKVQGPAGGVYPTAEMRGNSGTATNPVWSYSSFHQSTDDLIEANTNANLTLTLLGCVLDSNASGAIAGNFQVLTAHSGGKAEAWGCRITDASATSNEMQIWPDTTSEIHLFFCSALSSDITHTVGITLFRINTMYYCQWEKCRLFTFETRSCVWIGNRFIKDTTSTSACMLALSTDTCDYSMIMGNYFKPNNASATNSHGLDLRRTLEFVGNTVECTNASSCIPLRIAPTGAPASPLDPAVIVNNHFIAANALLEIGTSANLGIILVNNLFTGSATNMSIGATGAACEAYNNYAERSGAPTNWTTRFTTDINNTFSTTNVTFNADGSASNAGDGLDVGSAGAVDMKGNALFLGLPFIRGSVENQVIKATPYLYPDLT